MAEPMVEPIAEPMAEHEPQSVYSFGEIHAYLTNSEYPPDKPDKNYRRGLRKRCKYFCIQGGRLYYVGGKLDKVKTPRLVIEACEERHRIVRSIHDQGHLGRDKTLSEINTRYYWPDMYKHITAYVSFS